MTFLLNPDGSWALQNGVFLLNNATTQSALERCCCGGGTPETCDCDIFTDTLDARLKFCCLGPSAGQGQVYDYSEALTLQVGDPPDGLPGACPAATKYFKGTLAIACASPSSIEVELLCCGVTAGGLPNVLMRVDTEITTPATGWRAPDWVGSPCGCKYAIHSIANFTDTGANCGYCSPFVTPSTESLFLKCTTSSWDAEDDAC